MGTTGHRSPAGIVRGLFPSLIKPTRMKPIKRIEVTCDNSKWWSAITAVLTFDDNTTEEHTGDYYSLNHDRLQLFGSVGGSGYGFHPAPAPKLSIPLGNAVVVNYAGSDKCVER